MSSLISVRHRFIQDQRFISIHLIILSFPVLFNVVRVGHEEGGIILANRVALVIYLALVLATIVIIVVPLREVLFILGDLLLSLGEAHSLGSLLCIISPEILLPSR